MRLEVILSIENAKNLVSLLIVSILVQNEILCVSAKRFEERFAFFRFGEADTLGLLRMTWKGK